MITSFIIFILLIIASATLPPQQPVIGIYSQNAQQLAQIQITENTTYIAASYVKNLQMAGAQVVPIFYHYSFSQIQSLLGKLNGVFFPGGDMPIVWGNEWLDKIGFIFNYAKKQNELGNVYPIWSTCLGHEAIMYVTSGRNDNKTVFTQITGQDGFTCPLIVKNSNSKLLKTLSSIEFQQATTGSGLFFFHHNWTVLLDTYNQNSNWTNFWNLISTSKTIDGREFVSTLEAKQFPFYSTQYHPEKNLYEWRVSTKRTYNAISSAQKLANFFVNEARKNKNKPIDGQLQKKLIYNYQPILTPLDYMFVQIYVFDESNL